MKGKLKSILAGWLTHFVAIIIVMNVFHIYEYFTDPLYNGPTPWEFFLYHTFHDADILILLICLLYIEINYQSLFKKLRIFPFIFSCISVGIAGYATFMILQFDTHKGGLSKDLIQVLIISAYALFYSIIRNYLYQIRYRKELQLQQSKNELNALKAQINPHFLFNSLNYLYGTALNESASATADGIDKLSDMMRYTITGLHENFVPIKNEFNFIENYLSLQLARLPKKDNISIDINIPSILPGTQIAPLLILPFIENAFKYGISIDEPCFVYIKIEISGNKLMANINNSIVKQPIGIKGNNTGIKNTIQRLKLLYPDSHDLKQTHDEASHQTFLQVTLKHK